MTVRQFLTTVDSRELAEWLILYGLEPWGDMRDDLRAGIIASTIANCAGGKKKYKPSDFIPQWERAYRPPQTASDMKQVAKSFVAAMKANRK